LLVRWRLAGIGVRVPLDFAPRRVKKRPTVGCHRRNQKAAIEKQIPHFAACFRNEQAAVARRTVGCAITAPVVGLVVGTYGIVRADCRAFKSAS
jgi:hypothetical protein